MQRILSFVFILFTSGFRLDFLVCSLYTLLFYIDIVFLCIGCPIRQEIIDATSATAYGEGLERGFEDKSTSFYVDSKGHRGELVVQVEGTQHPFLSLSPFMVSSFFQAPTASPSATSPPTPRAGTK
jgi:hypothetical protein